MRLRIRVKPNAPELEVEVVGEKELKVSVKSPPQDGRANKELTNFLKKLLRKAGESPRVELVGGHTSRIKYVEVDLTWQQIKNVINSGSCSSDR
ncbi:MAG: DUF167 domain-containing protein [archaeon]